MNRETFEYEAGKALNLPTNIIEQARKGDGYDHAFDSMNIMQPLNEWWHWWKAGAASMQAERDQLAAECAALKAAFNPAVIPEEAVDAFTETAIMDHDWNDTAEWSWVENDTDVIRAVLDALMPQTPATDRFLAEQRAQGVEMFGQWAGSLGEWHRNKWVEVKAGEFAAQLRNEVNHD